MIDAPDPQLAAHRDRAREGLHVLEQPVPGTESAPRAELVRRQLHAIDQNGCSDDGAPIDGRLVWKLKACRSQSLSEAEPLCGRESSAARVNGKRPAVPGGPGSILDALARVSDGPCPPGLERDRAWTKFGDVVHAQSVADPGRAVGTADANDPQMRMARN